MCVRACVPVCVWFACACVGVSVCVLVPNLCDCLLYRSCGVEIWECCVELYKTVWELWGIVMLGCRACGGAVWSSGIGSEPLHTICNKQQDRDP